MRSNIVILFSLMLGASFVAFVSGAGHIGAKDPRLDYSNAGYVEKISVPFQLQTGILATEFARVTFPYSMHESITSDSRIPDGFFSPTGLRFSWQTYLNCATTGAETTAVSFMQNVLSTSYYLRFFSANGDAVGLTAGTWYMLNIYITSTTGLSRQRSNQPFYFGLSTLSSTSNTPVVYDENPSLVFLQMLTTPPATLGVEVAFADEFTKASVGLSQDVFFDIAATIGIDNQAKIELYFQGDDFKFTGSCISVERQAPPAIAALVTSDYTCTVVSSRRILLEHKKGFAAGFRVRIKTRVQNPTYVVSGASLQVRTFLAIQSIVIEQKLVSVFSTLPIALDQHQFNMLWDISAAASSFFPMQIRAIRGDSASPGYYPYNSFIIHFTPKSALPTAQEYIVNINLKGEAGDQILTGTINHNLPSFPGKRVNCTVINADAPTTTRRLACSGVGQLVSSVDYSVGFKMFFPYNIDTELIDLDTQFFGSVFIQTVNTVTGLAHGLSIVEVSSPKNVQKVKTQNNRDWRPTALYNEIIFSTQATASSDEPKTFRGLEYSTTNDRRLFMAIKAPLSHVTSTAANAAITNSAGIWITMNPAMSFADSSVLRDFCNAPYSTVTRTLNTRTSAPLHTSVKISATTTGTSSTGLSGLFNGLDSWVSFSDFKNAVAMSPYADSSVYDFYMVAIEGIEGAPNSQVVKSWVLVNAFMLGTTSFTSLRAGISNFYVGSDEILPGDTIPVIVRVSGKLTEAENTNVRALAVFFDSLEFFETQYSVNNKRNVSCSSSDKKMTCDGAQNPNSNANYATMSWTQFNFDTRTSDFSIIYPVRSVANKLPKNLYIATLQTGVYGTDNSFFRILQISRVSVSSLSGFSRSSCLADPPYYAAGLTSSSIDLDILPTCTGCQPGLPQEALTINAKSSVTIAKNTDEFVGAGFTFVSNFDWRTNVTVISFASTSDSTNPCLNFTYAYRTTSPVTETPKFGLFCPVTSSDVGSTSTVGITKTNLPYKDGRTLPAFGGFSNNAGQLVALKPQATKMTSSNPITEVTVSPAKLGKGVTKARLDFSFKTINPIFNGNTILIKFAANVNFVSSGVAYCVLVSATVPDIKHTCAITVINAQNIKYVITSSQEFPAGKFTLYHYEVDNTNSDGTDTTFLVRIFSKDAGNDATLITDAGWVDYLLGVQSGTGSPFQYLNTGASLPSLTVAYAFQTTNKKAQTIGDFTFTLNNRGFYSREQLLINLGGVATDNAGNPNVNCLVLTSQKAISTEFAVLDNSELSRIVIQPKADITTANTFILRCFNILVPFSDNPYDLNAQLIAVSNGLVLFQAASVPYTGLEKDASLGADEVRITSKTFNTAGSRNNITFSMKSSNVDIIATSRIKIVFPSYYQAGINPDGKIYCRLNNQNTQCSITGQRTIELTNSPVMIPRGTSFTVSIQGPVAAISTSVFNYFIAIDNDNIETTYTDFGLVQDLTTGGGILPQINNLLVYNATFSLTETRTKSSIQFLFYLPQSAGQLTVGRVIAVDFPALWGNVLEFSAINCEIYQQGDSVKNYASGCTAVGSRLIISIADTLQVSSFFFIVLQNVANPENAGCNDYDFVISVPDLGQTQVVLRSFSNLVNSRVPPYIDNVVKPRLYFANADGAGSEIQSIEITPGVYSPQFYVKAIGQTTFSVGFVLSLQSDIFTIKSGLGAALVGESAASLIIYCPQTTLGGEYYVFFSKDGDSGAYINLPLFKIIVRVSPITITLPVSDISVPSGSSFFPIYASLTGNYPISDVVLRFKTTNDLAGINFLNNVDAISLTFDNPEGLVQLYTNVTLALPTNKTVLNVSLEGTNKASYTLQKTSIGVTITDPLTSAPNLTLTASGKSSFSTKFDITLSCDQESIAYYQLAFSYCSLSSGKAQVKYNRDDYCQIQYGQVSIYSKGVARTVTLKNLLSNQNYSIQGVCVNPFNNVSSLVKSNFSTKDNGGKIMRLNIQFDGPVLFIHKQRLACFLSSHFQAPARYVISSEGVFCSQFVSRLLQSSASNSSNSTTNSSSNSSSGSSSPNTSVPVNNSGVQNVTLPENMLSYFILNIDERETDSLYSKVIADSNKRQFSFWIKGNISGLPNITKLVPAYDVNVTNNPALINSSLTVTGKYSYITLKTLRLIDSGFIYALAYPSIVNDTAPNPDQIRKGFYANGTELNRSISARGWGYSYLGGFVDVNITGLPSGKDYTVYYVGSNENPGNRSIYTQVYTVNYRLELNRSAIASGLPILTMMEALFGLLFAAMLLFN